MVKTGIGRKFLKEQYVVKNKSRVTPAFFVADVVKSYIIIFPSPSIYFTI